MRTARGALPLWTPRVPFFEKKGTEKSFGAKLRFAVMFFAEVLSDGSCSEVDSMRNEVSPKVLLVLFFQEKNKKITKETDFYEADP